jgi:hypothetical protein
MNTLNRIARLLAAVAAATVTTVLFATVVSIAEPQRSELIAKNAEQQQQRLVAARAVLQVAQTR